MKCILVTNYIKLSVKLLIPHGDINRFRDEGKVLIDDVLQEGKLCSEKKWGTHSFQNKYGTIIEVKALAEVLM